MKRRRVSINELKRRLMRVMARTGSRQRDLVVRQLRAHACALAFIEYRAVSSITNDSDIAAGWDESTVLSEIRSRVTVKK